MNWIANLPWQMIRRENLSAETIDIDWDNLEGDKDKIYLVRAFGECPLDCGMSMNFNNDSGSNYKFQQFRGYSTTANASSATSDSDIETMDFDAEKGIFERIIFAESGKERHCITDCCEDNISNGITCKAIDNWWTNTADEITSIQISQIGTNPFTGYFELYKLKGM